MTRQIDDMTCEEFDEYFDKGGDVSALFDNPEAEVLRPGRSDGQRTVNTTLPGWLVDVLDDEASRRGVSRRAVINTWLVDRADQEAARRKTA